MSWNTLQKEVADNYCGTVLVLDDEVFHRNAETAELITPATIDERFRKAKVAFEKRGTLCDLFNVDDHFENKDKTKQIEKAISRCDTVIVDWYLGRGKEETQDPQNAIKVLNCLAQSKGIRFAAIHSKENSEKIIETLKKTFGTAFVDLNASKAAAEEETEGDRVLTESEAQATQSATSPSTYQIGQSLYICVLHKDNAYASAAELPTLFHEHLKVAFPDHLHWAGFEFASRVRDMLPSLVRALPPGIDTALVFQALFQDDDELADDLVECLTLELREMFRFNGLKSAQDEILINRLILGFNQPGFNNTGLPQKWKDELPKLQSASELKTWAKASKILENRSHRDNLGTLIQRSISNDSTTPTDAHNRYASLREHLHSLASSELDLFPGAVLKRENDGNVEWMLCLTPGCDCARGGEHDHLFVKGYNKSDARIGSWKGVCTSLLIAGTYFEIKWVGSSFQTIKCNEKGPPDWNIVTRLHDPFVQKVIQHLWGQQTRVGVNTSEYLRKTRGDDE